jgi:hypothetical protein
MFGIWRTRGYHSDGLMIVHDWTEGMQDVQVAGQVYMGLGETGTVDTLEGGNVISRV